MNSKKTSSWKRHSNIKRHDQRNTEMHSNQNNENCRKRKRNKQKYNEVRNQIKSDTPSKNDTMNSKRTQSRRRHINNEGQKQTKSATPSSNYRAHFKRNRSKLKYVPPIYKDEHKQITSDVHSKNIERNSKRTQSKNRVNEHKQITSDMTPKNIKMKTKQKSSVQKDKIIENKKQNTPVTDSTDTTELTYEQITSAIRILERLSDEYDECESINSTKQNSSVVENKRKQMNPKKVVLREHNKSSVESKQKTADYSHNHNTVMKPYNQRVELTKEEPSKDMACTTSPSKNPPLCLRYEINKEGCRLIVDTNNKGENKTNKLKSKIVKNKLIADKSADLINSDLCEHTQTTNDHRVKHQMNHLGHHQESSNKGMDLTKFIQSSKSRQDSEKNSTMSNKVLNKSTSDSEKNPTRFNKVLNKPIEDSKRLSYSKKNSSTSNKLLNKTRNDSENNINKQNKLKKTEGNKLPEQMDQQSDSSESSNISDETMVFIESMINLPAETFIERTRPVKPIAKEQTPKEKSPSDHSLYLRQLSPAVRDTSIRINKMKGEQLPKPMNNLNDSSESQNTSDGMPELIKVVGKALTETFIDRIQPSNITAKDRIPKKESPSDNSLVEPSPAVRNKTNKSNKIRKIIENKNLKQKIDSQNQPKKEFKTPTSIRPIADNDRKYVIDYRKTNLAKMAYTSPKGKIISDSTLLDFDITKAPGCKNRGGFYRKVFGRNINNWPKEGENKVLSQSSLNEIVKTFNILNPDIDRKLRESIEQSILNTKVYNSNKSNTGETVETDTRVIIVLENCVETTPVVPLPKTNLQDNIRYNAFKNEYIIHFKNKIIFPLYKKPIDLVQEQWPIIFYAKIEDIPTECLDRIASYYGPNIGPELQTINKRAQCSNSLEQVDTMIVKPKSFTKCIKENEILQNLNFPRLSPSNIKYKNCSNNIIPASSQNDWSYIKHVNTYKGMSTKTTTRRSVLTPTSSYPLSLEPINESCVHNTPEIKDKKAEKPEKVTKDKKVTSKSVRKARAKRH